MKKLLLLVLFPLLVSAQEKMKFYDHIYFSPETQIGEYMDYYIYYGNPTSYPKEQIYKNWCSTLGGAGGYKDYFVSMGLEGLYTSNWNYAYRDFRLQSFAGVNLLFFTQVAKNKSALFAGPVLYAGNLFYKGDHIPLLGYGFDFSFCNIYLRFSKQIFQKQYSGETEITKGKDFYRMLSVGYQFNLNTFRKKQNKRIP